MNFTHILVKHPSQKACMLFRASDGLLCGMQHNCVVVFGISPKGKDSRTFIDEPAAEKWLRDIYAPMDLKEQNIEGVPVFDERDGESHGLWVPEDSIEMPGFGPAVKPIRH